MGRKYRTLLQTLAGTPAQAGELPEALRQELGWAEWSGHVRYNGVTKVYSVTPLVAAQLKAGKVFSKRPLTPRERFSRWLS